MDKAAKDNHANQINPNNSNFQQGKPAYTGDRGQSTLDNKANQGNPNHPNYSKGRQN